MIRFRSILLFSGLAWFLVLCQTCAPIGSGPVSGWQASLIQSAKSYRGTPYQYGGTRRGGMDCSGLIYRIYRQQGIAAPPRSVTDWLGKGQHRTVSQMQPGDLVFFNEKGRQKASHMGLYLGRRRFIHASRSRGVIISSLNNRHYKERLCAIRYVPPGLLK